MKKFKFKNPELLGLQKADYFAIETNKGYMMWITESHWVGMPKLLVENSNAFTFVTDESEPIHKSIRPRVRIKRIKIDKVKV